MKALTMFFADPKAEFIKYVLANRERLQREQKEKTFIIHQIIHERNDSVDKNYNM